MCNKNISDVTSLLLIDIRTRKSFKTVTNLSRVNLLTSQLIKVSRKKNLSSWHLWWKNKHCMVLFFLFFMSDTISLCWSEVNLSTTGHHSFKQTLSIHCLCIPYIQHRTTLIEIKMSHTHLILIYKSSVASSSTLLAAPHPKEAELQG